MDEIRGITCAVCSAVCFGMLAVLGKLAFARGFDTAEILQYRFGFGALLLLAFYAATDRRILRVRPKTLGKAAVLGVALYPVQSLCFMAALKYIPAATTSLILYAYPVVVALLSALLFKTRLDRLAAISLTLLVVGCGFVFYDAFLRSIDIRGLMLASASMLLFSLYLIALEVMLKDENPRSIAFYCVLASGLVYTLWRPPLRFARMDVASQAITVALGLIPAALAITLLYGAVERIGSAKTSICSTIEPITTVLASALLLGERVVAVQIVGMALILAGIILPNAHVLHLRPAAQRSLTPNAVSGKPKLPTTKRE